MRSMTGYGRIEKVVGNYNYTVEIKSLNGKYLNLKTSLAGIFSPLELKLQDYLKKHFGRGNLNVYVDIRFVNPENFVQIDGGLAKAYYHALSKIKTDLSMNDDITLDILTRFKEIIRINLDEQSMDEVWSGLSQCLNDVIIEVKKFQNREGLNLKVLLDDYIKQLSDIVESIYSESLKMKEEFMQKLNDDLNQLLKPDTKINPERLELEVALLAERSDISEEIERLKIHLKRFREIMESPEELKGQNLDFLSQEMHREFNTIASKSKIAEITNYSIDGRVIVNKVREQVQNIH
jgi:uncharacterized protein (TIGR00255 family)